MSVETFCNKYPADLDPNVIVELANSGGRSDMSPVVFLAVKLAEEGQDGARELINKLNPSNTMSEIDRQAFQRLSVIDKKNIFINLAAFVFGNSVVSLERSLVNREYDHEDFCERYNLGANNFQSEEIKAGTEKIEKLSDRQLAGMRSLIKEDKTFSIFFEEKGLQALPNTLRQFIESIGILPVIRKDILPIYKPRASLLVSHPNGIL